MKLLMSTLLLFFILIGCTNNDMKNMKAMNHEKILRPEILKEQLPMDKIIIPQYIVTNDWRIVPISEAEENVVLVTIDDAPDEYALEMAKTLKRINAQAIFFVNGHFLLSEEQKNTVREIYEMGFFIGNHTFNHQNLTNLTEREQYNEIILLNDEIEKITGERPTFFRAPFGVNTDFSKKIVEQEGMILMNWTYGYDWEPKYMTSDAIKNIMIQSPYLKNGAILLMHDRKWTNEALEAIILGLKARGYNIANPGLIKTPNKK